jgi:hypothetical protein
MENNKGASGNTDWDRKSEFESRLCHFPAVWLWANQLTSLNLNELWWRAKKIILEEECWLCY